MRVTVKVDLLRPPRKGYWGNLGEGVSQALAALVGMDSNLTLSAHCGRWQEQRRPVLQHLRHGPNVIISVPRIAGYLYRRIFHPRQSPALYETLGAQIDHNHCLNAWLELV